MDHHLSEFQNFAEPEYEAVIFGKGESRKRYLNRKIIESDQLVIFGLNDYWRFGLSGCTFMVSLDFESMIKLMYAPWYDKPEMVISPQWWWSINPRPPNMSWIPVNVVRYTYQIAELITDFSKTIQTWGHSITFSLVIIAGMGFKRVTMYGIDLEIPKGHLDHCQRPALDKLIPLIKQNQDIEIRTTGYHAAGTEKI